MHPRTHCKHVAPICGCNVAVVLETQTHCTICSAHRECNAKCGQRRGPTAKLIALICENNAVEQTAGSNALKTRTHCKAHSTYLRKQGSGADCKHGHTETCSTYFLAQRCSGNGNSNTFAKLVAPICQRIAAILTQTQAHSKDQNAYLRMQCNVSDGNDRDTAAKVIARICTCKAAFLTATSIILHNYVRLFAEPVQFH